MIPYLVATASRNSRSWSGGTVAASRRSWRLDLDHRLVEEGRRARRRTRPAPVSASSAQGPGIGFAPFGTLPERQPSSRSSRPRFGGEQQLLQVALGEDDDRFFAEDLAHVPVAR